MAAKLTWTGRTRNDEIVSEHNVFLSSGCGEQRENSDCRVNKVVHAALVAAGKWECYPSDASRPLRRFAVGATFRELMCRNAVEIGSEYPTL